LAVVSAAISNSRVESNQLAHIGDPAAAAMARINSTARSAGS